jgi:hypothetical protein
MAAVGRGPSGSSSYDEHHEKSRQAQRRADLWLLSGTIRMGTLVLGLVGFPLFLRGLALQVKAQRAGLTVRPVIVTLLGYLIVIDSALNSFGWALDMVAHHTLIDRVVLAAWGNMFDAAYFWHYNELWIGGASAPGEKAWEIALLPIVFSMRLAPKWRRIGFRDLIAIRDERLARQAHDEPARRFPSR